MKTTNEMRDKFNEETGLNYSLSDGKYRHWLEKQVRELYGQTLRYREFASQSSDKEEREPDGIVRGTVCYLKREVSEAVFKGLLDDSRAEPFYFSPPKESEGKELSEITDDMINKYNEYRVEKNIGGEPILQFQYWVKLFYNTKEIINDTIDFSKCQCQTYREVNQINDKWICAKCNLPTT